MMASRVSIDLKKPVHEDEFEVENEMMVRLLLDPEGFHMRTDKDNGTFRKVVDEMLMAEANHDDFYGKNLHCVQMKRSC